MTPLIRKLEQFVRLSPADLAILSRTSADRARKFPPRVDISREGDKPKDVHLILSGWACRYKQLEDGRLQGALGDLLRSDRHVFAARRRVAGAGDGAGDEGLGVHRCSAASTVGVLARSLRV